MNRETENQAFLDYQRIAQVIAYLEENYRQQPSLEEMAATVNLSKYHFQRLFKRWAGITPTQFLHFLTLDYAKSQLAAARNVLDASLESGLSGPGRLHDLFVTFEAMTPGEYKRRGAGMQIQYGFHETPFGTCLMAMTPRGICALRFVEAAREESLTTLQAEWDEATFVEAPMATAEVVQRLFAHERVNGQKRPFHLLLRGTNFQIQVWRALLAIPQGCMVSYQDVAISMGKPTATRAVASAIARNPIGYIIPCHRVISKYGRRHNYRWGATRKKVMLGWEAGQKQH